MARTRKSKTQTESSSTEPQQETDDTTWPEADQVQDAVILEEADQVGVPEEPQADTEDATPVELDEPERADPPEVEDTAETVAAESHEKTRPAPPPVAAPQKSGPGFFTMLLGGAAAAAIGFGASQYLGNDAWPFSGRSSGIEDLTQQVSGQTEQLETVSAQVQALQSGADKLASDLSGLATLQTAQDELRQSLASLTESQSAFAQRLTDLENRPISDAGADKDAVAAYQQQLAAMRAMFEAELKRIEAAQSNVSTLEEAAAAQAKAAMSRATVARLQAAIDSGSPYPDVVDALAGAGVDVPVALASQAAQGVPSLGDLQQSFPAAARAALDASIRAQAESGEVDKLTAFLRRQLGTRSLEPKEGTDPDAILSRAEAALRDGDLSVVLSELGGLTAAGAESMAAWMTTARLRQDAVSAVAALSETLNN